MGWITTGEASQLSGLSGGYLRRLLAKGLIRGKRFGHVWLVSKTSLEKYIVIERKPGPQAKEKRNKKSFESNENTIDN